MIFHIFKLHLNLAFCLPKQTNSNGTVKILVFHHISDIFHIWENISISRKFIYLVVFKINAYFSKFWKYFLKFHRISNFWDKYYNEVIVIVSAATHQNFVITIKPQFDGFSRWGTVSFIPSFTLFVDDRFTHLNFMQCSCFAYFNTSLAYFTIHFGNSFWIKYKILVHSYKNT